MSLDSILATDDLLSPSQNIQLCCSPCYHILLIFILLSQQLLGLISLFFLLYLTSKQWIPWHQSGLDFLDLYCLLEANLSGSRPLTATENVYLLAYVQHFKLWSICCRLNSAVYLPSPYQLSNKNFNLSVAKSKSWSPPWYCLPRLVSVISINHSPRLLKLKNK